MTSDTTTPGSTHRWGLRYAPHVGYLPGVQPLFESLVGDSDLAYHAAFAAAQGFAGLLNPWIAWGTAAEVERFHSILRANRLEAGCVVYAPFQAVLKPTWSSRDASERRELLDHVRSSADIAARLGSRTLAVLIMGRPDETVAAQLSAVRDNLKLAADETSRRGVMLGVEAMVAVPGMLFRSIYQAAELLEDLRHPGVKLIFDTGHVAEMDGDVLAAQARLRDHIGLYQLSDFPGRVEAGAGTIDFETLLRQLHHSRYEGLIELEHDWSMGGPQNESDGIAHLRSLDARAAQESKGEAR